MVRGRGRGRVRLRLRVTVRGKVGVKVRVRVRGAAHFWFGKEPEAVVRRAGGDVRGNVVVRVDEPGQG